MPAVWLFAMKGSLSAGGSAWHPPPAGLALPVAPLAAARCTSSRSCAAASATGSREVHWSAKARGCGNGTAANESLATSAPGQSRAAHSPPSLADGARRQSAYRAARADRAAGLDRGRCQQQLLLAERVLALGVHGIPGPVQARRLAIWPLKHIVRRHVHKLDPPPARAPRRQRPRTLRGESWPRTSRRAKRRVQFPARWLQGSRRRRARTQGAT
jgi:hypothetical protein